MRGAKSFSVLLLMFMLTSVVLLPTAHAQELTITQSTLLTSELPRNPEDFTLAQLKRFVQLALSNQITGDQAQNVYNSLNKRQQAIAVAIIDQKLHELEDNDRLSTSSLVMSFSSNYTWQQFIENAWTIGYPDGSTFASSYSTTSTTCDTDPDTDYVFYFNFPASNPDGIRWTSDSAQVFAAFRFGMSLNSYGYSFSEVNLCAGDTTVSLAGGADNVKNNIFIHY